MSNPNFITHSHEHNHKLRLGIALAAVALTTVVGFESTTNAISNASDKITHMTDGVEFSDTTHPYSVGSGEGLNDAASTIKGIDNIDIREATGHIRNMSENETVLEDGLQPGEVLTVPDSVE